MPWYLVTLIVVVMVLGFSYLVLGVKTTGGLIAMGVLAGVMTAAGIGAKNATRAVQSIVEDNLPISSAGETSDKVFIGQGEDADEANRRSLESLVGDPTAMGRDAFLEKYRTLSDEDKIRVKFLLNQLDETEILEIVGKKSE